MLRGLVELTHRRVDLAYARRLLGGRRRNFLHQVCRLADGGHHLLEQLAGFFCQFHAAAGHFANFLRRHLAALGELAHLGGHHGKALAMFTGAGRFNRGVQGQQIGLRGNVIDDADLLGNFFHRRHRGIDRLAAIGRVLRGLGSHALGDLGVFGVLRNAGRHLLDGGASFLHACGLFAGRL